MECVATDERQAQFRTIASELLSWKGGLKVLRQAQLPTWRGSFKWQIEAKIETLQAAYARVRAECAKPDGYTLPSGSRKRPPEQSSGCSGFPMRC